MLLPTGYSGWREFIKHLAQSKHPKISGFCFYYCCCCYYCYYYWLAVPIWKGEVGQGDLFRYHTQKPQTTPLIVPGGFRCGVWLWNYSALQRILQPLHPLQLLQVAAVAPCPSHLPCGLNPRAETTGGTCVPVSLCFGLGAQDQQPWSPFCR